MALQTIKDSLNNSLITKEKHFFNDVQLVWENCKQYNASNSLIYETCKIMEKHAKDLEDLYYKDRLDDRFDLPWYKENEKRMQGEDANAKKPKNRKPSKKKEVKANGKRKVVNDDDDEEGQSEESVEGNEESGSDEMDVDDEGSEDSGAQESEENSVGEEVNEEVDEEDEESDKPKVKFDPIEDDEDSDEDQEDDDSVSEAESEDKNSKTTNKKKKVNVKKIQKKISKIAIKDESAAKKTSSVKKPKKEAPKRLIKELAEYNNSPQRSKKATPTPSINGSKTSAQKSSKSKQEAGSSNSKSTSKDDSTSKKDRKYVKKLKNRLSEDQKAEIVRLFNLLGTTKLQTAFVKDVEKINSALLRKDKDNKYYIINLNKALIPQYQPLIDSLEKLIKTKS
jgi:hypothetical protein